MKKIRLLFYRSKLLRFVSLIVLLLLVAAILRIDNVKEKKNNIISTINNIVFRKNGCDLHFGKKSQFFAIIDAGSTGSRIYIYSLCDSNGKGNINYLKDKSGNIISSKATPGLSSFKNDLDGAVKQIAGLVKWLENQLSESMINRTSVSIMATAGMRLLSIKDQNKIFEHLKSELPKHIKIKLRVVKLITGKSEGLYQWLASNYIQDFIQISEHLPDGSHNVFVSKGETNGIVELGGASLQISFNKFTKTDYIQSNKKKSMFRMRLNHIVSKSMLGYGFHSIYDWFFTFKKSSFQNLDNFLKSRENCLPFNSVKIINIGSINYTLKGTGDIVKCIKDIENSMVTDKLLFYVPEMNLYYFPNSNQIQSKTGYVTIDIPHGMNFDGFSEFYYGSKVVLNYDDLISNSGKRFLMASINYCSSDFEMKWEKALKDNPGKANKEELMNQCFKSAYILILKKVITDDSNSIKPILTLKDMDVQWTLGAIIYNLMNGDE